MSYRRWNSPRRWKNYNRPNRGNGSKGSAKANASKPGVYKIPYRPKRNKVYYSKEARQLQKNDPVQMGKRRVPRTRRPQPPQLYSRQAPEQMPWWRSAYLSNSVMPERVSDNANLLNIGQQHLPYGMKPRTIDGPDHY